MDAKIIYFFANKLFAQNIYKYVHKKNKYK